MKIVYEQNLRVRKPYGCLAFIFDVVMTFVTCGFWLIWVFCREMRKR
jgi:hypothetical protein